VAQLESKWLIKHFEFSPRGDEVAVASSQGVKFWSTSTWQLERELTNFTGILYQPMQQAFWLTTDLRSAGLYATRTLEPLLLLPTGMLPVAVSRDGEHLAVNINAQRLMVLDLSEIHHRLRQFGIDWEMR
jgi:hypothetical protein